MTQIEIPSEGDNIPRVIIGDVIKALNKVPDESIDCVVTSPPYWQQRDYGFDDQIGLEDESIEYVNQMVKIGNQIRRILKSEGSYFLNVGDKYLKKDLQMIPSRIATKMQKNGWILRNFIVWYKPNHMPSPIKDRFTTTWEPIFFFVKDTDNYTTPEYHFFLDNIRIPHKSNNGEKYDPKKILSNEEYNNLPEKLKNIDDLPRYIDVNTYEKIPKSLKKKENGEYEGKFKNAKKMNLGASPGARLSVNGIYYSGPYRKYNPNELDVIKYLREWKTKKGYSISDIASKTNIKETTVSHWFRTDRGGRCLPDHEDWLKLKDVLGFDKKYDKEMTEVHYKLQGLKQNENGKNPGDMWSMNTGSLSKAHFSIFPEELPKRVIESVCPKDGIVLDPFAGSGTTGKVARQLNRRSILIELQEDYIDIIKERCGEIIVVKNNEMQKLSSKQPWIESYG